MFRNLLAAFSAYGIAALILIQTDPMGYALMDSYRGLYMLWLVLICTGSGFIGAAIKEIFDGR